MFCPHLLSNEMSSIVSTDSQWQEAKNPPKTSDAYFTFLNLKPVIQNPISN